ncbi:MAG: hypothetical protein AAFN77_00470 [Planctomycetota bacterium]
MKLTLKSIATVTALMLFNVSLVSTISAQTDQQEKLPSALEIMKKHVAETGGVENYKAVKSMMAEGTMSIPQAGINGEMTMKMMLPGKLAVEATIPGIGETVQGSNGEFMWSSDPMTGTKLIDGKQAEQMKTQADYKRYTNPKEVFKSMKTVGIEEANGEKAYKLELERKSGDKLTEFYSVESGLLIQSVMKVEAAGMGEMEITTKIGDYKKTGKLLAAHKLVQVLPSVGMEQIIEFSKLEYNSDSVKEADFAPPADVQKMIDKKKSKKSDEKEID